MTGAMAPRLAALLSIGQVADLLGVSRHVVARWVQAGHLTTVNFGRRRWIPIASLKARALVWDSVLLMMQADASQARTRSSRG